MYEGKPIIGIAGGIGSGKSFVAKVFGEEGCMVISSDQLAHQVYRDFKVKETLRHWWGPMVVGPNGEIDRGVVARKVFTSPNERQRLEALVHPIVNQQRERMMKQAAQDPSIHAYVWDTPLLFETGLNKQCDLVVFVDAPRELRLKRLAGRGWDDAELARRENSQMPLDKKRQTADYIITNTADGSAAENVAETDVEVVRGQVREVLSRILAGSTR